MRKNSLGKGLQALIETKPGASGGILSLPVERIKPGSAQPRKNFNPRALAGLADSIKEKGLIQPLIVRKPADGDGYEIVAGERRWRAAQKAGIREVPVIVREMADPESVEVALIENIQREDLNPLEEAWAYEKLVSDFGMTHDEVSKRVGKSRSDITNHLRLLKLSEAAREALLSGAISNGHARAVLGLKSASDEEAVVRKVVDGGLSVRQTERLVNSVNAGKASPVKSRPVSETDIYLKQAERSIRETLQAKVRIEGSRHKGSIVVKYSSERELERLSFEMANRSPLPGRSKE